MRLDQAFSQRIERLLVDRLALPGFAVTGVQKIAGAGLSRSVVRVDTRSDAEAERAYILLIEDTASPVPPNIHAEYAALRALSQRPDITVPRAYHLEDNGELIGHPFLVTQMLPGTTNPRDLMKEAYVAHGPRITTHGYEVLGRLAAIDPGTIDFGASIPVPTAAMAPALTLELLERRLHDIQAQTMPITQAALRHLHRTMPTGASRVSVVHGDYRIGNYLFDANGVTGVIDWEMVHLGDPLEDLAWSLLPNWHFAARPGLPGGFLTQDEAIAAWESTSGLKVDPQALQWWLVYNHLKALCIWATSRHMVNTGKTREPMMALVACDLPEKQESYIAQMLKEYWA